MKKELLHVEDMVCSHCEITVQDAARKLPGVKKAKANRRRKELLVEYDEDIATIAEIKDAVGATGYRIVDGGLVRGI